MAGIYIHIPFCKKACNYCDFHFSTSLKKRDEMVLAIIAELIIRKQEYVTETVTTIYFGGGTPSLLSLVEIQKIIATIFENYNVGENPEVTLEANPDDLSEEKIKMLARTPINRLSIGVQSFFEEDLQLMNRAHNAQEANQCLKLAKQYFDNISIDLIYGVPNMSLEKWEQNINIALELQIPHISSYALTVEPKTALEKLIQKGKIASPKDELAQKHFYRLIDKLTAANYIHYELSNFGKEGYFSQNNTAYWVGKKYMGIGPSAHSFDGKHRSWNIANNMKYVQAIQNSILPNEIENLSKTDRFNEYMMTGLRTMWGISYDKVANDFGNLFLEYLKKQSQKHILKDLLYLENKTLKTTEKGKFFSDGISSDLFKID